MLSIGVCINYIRILINRGTSGQDIECVPCHRFLPFNTLDEGIRAEVTYCSAIGEGKGHSLIRIVDSNGTLSKKQLPEGTVKSQLGGEYGIIRLSQIQYIATVTNDKCQLANLITSSGCFLLSAVHHEKHIVEWGIMALCKNCIDNLLDALKERGYGVEILSIPKIDTKSTLTDKQEIALAIAYELGYYDVPRKITIENLSEKLGYSKSNLSVMLREAEKKLIAGYLCLEKVFNR